MTSRNPAPVLAEKANLYGLDRQQLAAFLERFGARPFHARQIFRWLYARRTFDIASWTDLGRGLREEIARNAVADPGSLGAGATAADGTVKYRARLAQGGSVECVFMVQSRRVTLCLSSQVGCALDCDFCLTGKMGFDRHLSAGEIAGQVALIQYERGLIDPFNVVFMGMGEPLHNYSAVTAAIRLLTDPAGFALARRRITLSTAGLAPAIERLAGEVVRPRLAVSLNATTDELRDRLMPINRRYPIPRLLEACRRFTETGREPVTFEYVLLAGVNDSGEDLARLASIAKDARAKLNLIPFNPVPGRLAYRPPAKEQVLRIRERLRDQGVPVSVRWSRGADARAACGQLALLPSET